MLLPVVPPAEAECIHGVAMLPFIAFENSVEHIMLLGRTRNQFKNFQKCVDVEVVTSPHTEEVEIDITVSLSPGARLLS